MGHRMPQGLQAFVAIAGDHRQGAALGGGFTQRMVRAINGDRQGIAIQALADLAHGFAVGLSLIDHHVVSIRQSQSEFRHADLPSSGGSSKSQHSAAPYHTVTIIKIPMPGGGNGKKVFGGGRYWTRTSDPLPVKQVL